MNKKSTFIKSFFLAIGFTSVLNAQLVDEKDVTVTLDLQPVLELEMTTPNQIEFVFDDISEYYAGITQYAATVLKVSSTVSWDLYVVGRSQAGTRFWDQQVSYSATTNSSPNIPMSALEVRQSQPNPVTGALTATPAFLDYSANFATSQNSPSAANSLFVNDDGSGTPPTVTDKYIAGYAGTTGTGDSVVGGSYLTQTGTSSDYYYVMDYRILPGLPAIFPNAAVANGTTFEDLATTNASPTSFAQSGVYTMYVQYVLLEDQ